MHALSEKHPHPFSYRSANRSKQKLAQGGHSTADDDLLYGCQRNCIGDSEPQIPCCLVDGGGDGVIALSRRDGHFFRCDLSPVAFDQRSQARGGASARQRNSLCAERRTADQSLKAPSAATTASGTIRQYRGVANFSCCPTHAQAQSSVEDQTTANSRTDRDHQHVTRSMIRAKTILTECGESGIVQQECGLAGSLRQKFGCGKSTPLLGQIGEKLDNALGRIDQTRHADANGAGFSLRLVGDALQDLNNAIERVSGPGSGLSINSCISENPSGAGASNNEDFGAAQIDATAGCLE